MQAALSATPAVLTVELEPSAVMTGRPPEPLDRDRAELLAAPIADDLRRIVGEEVESAGLILPAALYDLTELLRPGLPMVEAMLDIYRGSLRGGAFQPQLLAIGSAGGRFPESAIAPAREPGSGPLLAVPFALVAPGPQLDPLRQTLESTLLEKGRASLATDRALRQMLGVEPVNLSYATFHDLSALMKVQLEHAGFGELWQLIEASLYRPDSVEVQALSAGNRFIAFGGSVWTPWKTWDQSVEERPDDPRAAEEDYTTWTQNQRQTMAGLARHGVHVSVTAPASGIGADDPEVALSVAQAHALPDDQGWYREPVVGSLEAARATHNVAVISGTEQSLPSLGPVAYTVMIQSADGSLLLLEHDYPIRENGIRALLQHWEAQAAELGATWHLERPERLTTSAETGQLQPWLEFGGSA